MKTIKKQNYAASPSFGEPTTISKASLVKRLHKAGWWLAVDGAPEFETWNNKDKQSILICIDMELSDGNRTTWEFYPDEQTMDLDQHPMGTDFASLVRLLDGHIAEVL